MKIRRALLMAASLALGAMLIFLVIRIGKVNVRLILDEVASVSRLDFMKLGSLNVLLVYLSSEKWRKVDAAVRRSSDATLSRIASFFISSAGMALGLVLPVQLGMTCARLLGTHLYGGAMRRGAVGTLFEQSFDLMVVMFLALASGFTWLCHGEGVMWSVFAIVMIALALLVVGPSIRVMLWLFHGSSRKDLNGYAGLITTCLDNLWRRIPLRFSELQHSGLMNPRLARRLITLSAARFGVVILMAGQIANAIRVHIPLWHLAAAMPFAAIANVIGITPGGIGVNEISSSTTLHLFGTSLAVASQWAVANRILAVGSCFAVFACAYVILGVEKIAINAARMTNRNGKAADN